MSADVGLTSEGPAPDAPPLDLRPVDQGNGDAGFPGVWVTVPKGTFSMGAPADEPCRLFNEDFHTVTLTHEFAIQATEVTQAQFLSLMGYNPSYFGPAGAGQPCGLDCPVEMVNWYEAAAYCNALSQLAGKDLCYQCTGSGATVACLEAPAYDGAGIYDCPGYRLPTDAEWERAYRAGTQTAYYNGVNDEAACDSCSLIDSNADKIGWYCANPGGRTQPVKQKTPNTWGLHDMAGNVWEWCNDWYKDHLGTAAAVDPWGDAPQEFRVTRGGSWYVQAWFLRAAKRNVHSPSFRNSNHGFRCVRTR